MVSKLCIDCRHHRLVETTETVGLIFRREVKGEEHICAAHLDPVVDLVTGAVRVRHPNFPCKMARYFIADFCGEEGKRWEPRAA
jgi:hypothetical protein